MRLIALFGMVLGMGAVLVACRPPCPHPTQTCNRLSVDISTVTGSGVVRSVPPGISCSVTDGQIRELAICSEEFDPGADVTLTVEPGNTTAFDGWGGDCTGMSSSCAVSMSEPRSVSALLPRKAIIGVDGSNLLSFTASAGSNPSPQEKVLSNRGDRSLEFTASFNQPWLSVSPLMGSVPPNGNLVVSVMIDADQLSRGTYQGQITLSDPDAGNTPRFLEVTLTVN